MYAVRLNTDETSIDCLQQANVLTNQRTQMASLSKTSRVSLSRTWDAVDWHQLISVGDNHG
jgi:hypothetical protein